MNLWQMAGLLGGIWLGWTIGGGPIGAGFLGLIGMAVGWAIGFLRWSAREQRINTALARAKDATEKRGDTWEDPDDRDSDFPGRTPFS